MLVGDLVVCLVLVGVVLGLWLWGLCYCGGWCVWGFRLLVGGLMRVCCGGGVGVWVVW